MEQQEKNLLDRDDATHEAVDKLRDEALRPKNATAGTVEKYDQIRKEINDGLFIGNREFFRHSDHLTPESRAGYEKSLAAMSRVNMAELNDLIAADKRQLRASAEPDPQKAEKISREVEKLQDVRDSVVSVRLLYASRLFGESEMGLARKIAEDAVKAVPRSGALDANRDLLEKLGVKVEAGGLEAGEMKDVFAAVLPKLDKDKNGRLSKDEILKGASDPGIKGQEAQLLAVLKKHYDQFTGLNNDDWFWENGISANDMQKFHEGFDQGIKDPQKMSPLAGEIVTDLSLSTNKLKQASLGLFGDSKDPLHSICPEAVNQSTELGDCYFMAALASLAGSDPNAIKTMIADNNDGSYTVRFPGAKDEPIKVQRPTDTELCLYAESNENGIWPAVLEKAFGDYCRRNVFRRSPFNLGGGELPSEGTTGGSATHYGVEILSGRSVELLDKDNEQHLHDQLTVAFRDKSPITASIHGDVLDKFTWGFFKMPNTHELPTGHEYSILKYDPVSRMATVRNPWGKGGYKRADGKVEGEATGTFKLTLAELRENFTEIAAATKKS
jgi:hypothetical protein